MKSSFTWAACALVVACSSTTTATPPADGGPAACDPAQCLPGNLCLTYGGETKCRKPCSSNTDASKSCPFGYTCSGAGTNGCTRVADPAAGVAACGEAFRGGVFDCPVAPALGCTASTTSPGKFCCPESSCIKDSGELTKKPAGQWGALCKATAGFDNADCDTAQGFDGFGSSPTDGAAYCTRFDCTEDRGCAAGFYCGDANVGPSVATADRTIGEVRKVCQRREYCSPCVSDLDCPAFNGVTQHCVGDDDYKGICMPECAATANCPFDATCKDTGVGTPTCYPRAGRCVGDGSLCAPCRSDVDCGEDGACVRGQYTTERSCAKKSKITCKDGQTQGTDFDCDKVAVPKASVRCLGAAKNGSHGVFEQVPENYCHGLYPLGQSADIGCWTPER